MININIINTIIDSKWLLTIIIYVIQRKITIRRYIVKTIIKTLLFAYFTLSLNLFAAETININTADRDTLIQVIKGVGDKKADAIIEYRETNGAFKSVSEITNVKGINEGILEANKDVLSISDT